MGREEVQVLISGLLIEQCPLCTDDADASRIRQSPDISMEWKETAECGMNVII